MTVIFQTLKVGCSRSISEITIVPSTPVSHFIYTYVVPDAVMHSADKDYCTRGGGEPFMACANFKIFGPGPKFNIKR